MKIFAIRDESAAEQTDLAYLLYYEVEKRFYIELPDNADPWETPLLLSSFVKKGEKTVNSYWSKIWVQQRIVPTDRQNLGQILKENNLKEYDEFGLLMLSMGRCAQDDYYLAPVDETQLPEQIKERFSKRIEDIIPLENYSLLVFFRDGTIKKCELKEHFEKKAVFNILLRNENLFFNIHLQTGGHGVEWDDNMCITDSMLYGIGKDIPLSASDFRNFVMHRVVNVAEAAEILGCTRQNIDYLTKTGKLHPIKSTEKNTLYLKSEILKRNWQ
ncbi:MAG: helix-turn-helix domain-containing protein [Oscillospiraceae bacterium]|nr:helix-turn-helix domain-containing protein [Oscillospiraceae bacterium]MBQ4643435.1 helix-turn-helix domain-containing protein [Oscillospiraceae bacterium]MBQ6877120.1 helix-turn-helix domain-containing protein [Oscillospiraceae bacterium]